MISELHVNQSRGSKNQMNESNKRSQERLNGAERGVICCSMERLSSLLRRDMILFSGSSKLASGDVKKWHKYLTFFASKGKKKTGRGYKCWRWVALRWNGSRNKAQPSPFFSDTLNPGRAKYWCSSVWFHIPLQRCRSAESSWTHMWNDIQPCRRRRYTPTPSSPHSSSVTVSARGSGTTQYYPSTHKTDISNHEMWAADPLSLVRVTY